MESPGRIRLPELSIFRKYSLALRQEFSQAEDVLAALRETYAEVEESTGVISEPLQARSAVVRRPGPAEIIEAEPEAKPPAPPEQRGKTFRLDSLPEQEPEPAAAPAAPGPPPPPVPARRIFEDDDPRSYLKRLAASRPVEFPDDESAEAGSTTGSVEDEEDGPRATSPTDEESFWNRAKRRPKKDDQ
ncbi:MAG: hypothetical protein ACRDIU_03340 [Actinomycetota bacterium]